jgi:hypothetical protein
LVEESHQVLSQHGKIVLRGFPDNSIVENTVSVNEDIAKVDDSPVVAKPCGRCFIQLGKLGDGLPHHKELTLHTRSE